MYILKHNKIFIGLGLMLLFNLPLYSNETRLEEITSFISGNLGESDEHDKFEKSLLELEAYYLSGAEMSLSDQFLLSKAYRVLGLNKNTNGNSDSDLDKKSDSLKIELGKKVLEKINEGTELNSDQRELYSEILMHYSNRIDPSLKTDMVKKVLEINPTNASVNFSLGWSMLNNDGNEVEGFAQMEKSLSMAEYEDAIRIAKNIMGEYNKRGRYEDTARVFAILELRPLDRDISITYKAYVKDYPENVKKYGTISMPQQSTPHQTQPKLTEKHLPPKEVSKVDPLVKSKQKIASFKLEYLYLIGGILLFLGIGFGVYKYTSLKK